MPKVDRKVDRPKYLGLRDQGKGVLDTSVTNMTQQYLADILHQFKEDLSKDVEPLSSDHSRFQKNKNKFADTFNKEYEIGYELLLNVLMEEKKPNVKQ